MLKFPYSAARGPNRTAWAVVLVLLHLIVAPCATAMMLMPADADCEHCQTSNTPDACAVDSAATSSAMGSVAFDSGRSQPILLLPTVVSSSLSESGATANQAPLLTPRHSGDPPLYLLLGQLRI